MIISERLVKDIKDDIEDEIYDELKQELTISLKNELSIYKAKLKKKIYEQTKSDLLAAITETKESENQDVAVQVEEVVSEQEETKKSKSFLGIL